MAEVHLCFPISESVYKSMLQIGAPCGSAQGMITGQTYLEKWGCTTHLPKSPAAARICPGLHSTHVAEELAVPCGPADLHDTRSDHSNFIVPHPSIHTKRCNAHFQKKRHRSEPGKSKGMAAHHQCLKTRDNRPLRRWNLSFLITAPAGLLSPSLCILSDKIYKTEGRMLFYSLVSMEFQIERTGRPQSKNQWWPLASFELLTEVCSHRRIFTNA